MIELNEILEHYAEAFKAVDAAGHVNLPYKPGLGPFSEPGALALALQYLKQTMPQLYHSAGPVAYPGLRKQCDLVLRGKWAIEWKLLRPFGDNGKPAEHWSENILHPYPGNTSSISDCFKLAQSGFVERKAVLVYGFEHSPPQIVLETAVQAFEAIARHVIGIKLGPRQSVTIAGLIHPVHQQARIYGWEVLEVPNMTHLP